METKKPFKIGKLLNKVLIIEMYLNNVFEPAFGWKYLSNLLNLSDDEEIKQNSFCYKIAIEELKSEGIKITPWVKEIVIDFLEGLRINLKITKRKLEGKDY